MESLSSDGQNALEQVANYIGGAGNARQAAWQAGWAKCAATLARWITEKREAGKAVARG